jgi:hypothetical protein
LIITLNKTKTKISAGADFCFGIYTTALEPILARIAKQKQTPPRRQPPSGTASQKNCPYIF